MRQPANVVGLLERAAAAAGSHAAFLHYEGGVLSFGDVLERCRRAASGLRQLGVERGDRVLVVMPNQPGFLTAWFGAAWLGAVTVSASPRATARELRALVDKVEPSVLVTDSAGEPGLRERFAGGPPIVVTDELAATSARLAPESPLDAWDEPVVLLQTSGTTSTPKLVTQSHRGYVLTGEAFPAWLQLRSDDRLLAAMPLHHINAQAYSTLGALSLGAQLVYLRSFSASTFWDTVRSSRVTQFNAVGPMLEMLLHQPPRGDDSAHGVRICYSAPAFETRRHLEFEARFGIRLVSGYGLSESPFGTMWLPDRPPLYESMGYLRQHPTLGNVNEGRVVAPAGHDVADGEVGELWLRNPAVMLGYFRDPEQTALTLADGWLKTGDLVCRDEGGVFFHRGRLKEVIRSRGENIAPAEVERVVSEHPAVTAAAVVGVPSPLGEEDVAVFVVPSDPEIDVAALRDWWSSQLAPYKRPRWIGLVDVLPLTDTGRIAKHRLPREILRPMEP